MRSPRASDRESASGRARRLDPRRPGCRAMSAARTLRAGVDAGGSKTLAVVAGTGSIALGRDARGATARSGGWGHLIGDEGSGYDIGRSCLQAVTRAADGRGPPTTLVDLLAHTWGLNSPTEIIGRVYPAE